MPAQPVPYGDVLAANVRAARVRVRPVLTQASVARRMRQLGCKWHFQTVGNVERGERPLSAYELAALSFVLGTTAEVLLLPPGDIQLVTFGEHGEHVISSQRLAAPDDSVSWDGDDLKVTPPTEVYRPADLRREAVAAMEAALAKFRQVESGEATLEPPHPGDRGAEDILPQRRGGDPPGK